MSNTADAAAATKDAWTVKVDGVYTIKTVFESEAAAREFVADEVSKRGCNPQKFTIQQVPPRVQSPAVRGQPSSAKRLALASQQGAKRVREETKVKSEEA